MIRMAASASLAVLLVLAACSKQEEATVSSAYVPQAEFCVTPRTGGSPLCPIIPGNIGPDPMLAVPIAYNGIIGAPPTSKDNDVQTPFDNLSWQTFVALNWTLGKQNLPPEQGLQGNGPRVWEGWSSVAELFGNGVQANCPTPPPGVKVFSIASNGRGEPVGQNEEFIQAATGDPLIDLSGNWAVYERRVNDVERAYLKAPNGNPAYTLTTLQGQANLVKAKIPVDFPSVGPTGVPPTGAIEVKATWRVLDPAQRAQNQKRFYVVPALLKVAPDLVKTGKPVCALVDMGLVAMHIIQKNPPPTPQTKNLLPQWFWSTFEHVDNAPLAKTPCDPAVSALQCGWLGNENCTADLPSSPPNYSFYDPTCPSCAVNQAPQLKAGQKSFLWDAQVPFAGDYRVPSGPGGKLVGTQVSRCWQIYALTRELNVQWRQALGQINSVFQNYMLVGTQWGGDITNPPNPKVPSDAVPSYLSNSVVETYLQTSFDPNVGVGSCVTCHVGATLPSPNTSVPSDLSFLPYLAKPSLVRREMLENLRRRQQQAQSAQRER